MGEKKVFVHGALPVSASWPDDRQEKKLRRGGNAGGARAITGPDRTALPAFWPMWRLFPAAPGSAKQIEAKQNSCCRTWSESEKSPGRDLGATDRAALGLSAQSTAVCALCPQKGTRAGGVSGSVTGASWPTCRNATCWIPVSLQLLPTFRPDLFHGCAANHSTD